MGLAGCGSARKPQLIILPTYSYVQESLATGETASVLHTSIAGEMDCSRAERLDRSMGKTPTGM